MVLLPEWFFLRQRFLSVALLPERSFLQLRSALVLVFVPEQALYHRRKDSWNQSSHNNRRHRYPNIHTKLRLRVFPLEKDKLPEMVSMVMLLVMPAIQTEHRQHSTKSKTPGISPQRIPVLPMA